jgi:hypothetical protein
MFISAVPHFRKKLPRIPPFVPMPVSHVLGRLSISSSVIPGENTPVTIPFVALELRRGVVSVDNWTVRLFPSVATDYVQTSKLYWSDYSSVERAVTKKIGFSANLDKFGLAHAGVCEPPDVKVKCSVIPSPLKSVCHT